MIKRQTIHLLVLPKIFFVILLTAGLCLYAWHGRAQQEPPAVLFEAQDLDTEVGSLSILGTIQNMKGRVVVVNFWASWCPPCVVEIPELKKVRETFSPDELYLMGVSIDHDHAAFKRFVARTAFNYPVRRAQRVVSGLFGIDSIPRLLVYNTAGDLVIDKRGIVDGDSLIEAVRTLLKEHQVR